MDRFNNRIVVFGGDLKKIMPVWEYDNRVKDRKFKILRKGGGKDSPALIDYDLMPPKYRNMYEEAFGDPRKMMKRNALQEMIEPDFKAASYFAEFQFDDETGIKPERQAEYAANASVLNAVGRLLVKKTGERKKQSRRTFGIWAEISDLVNRIDEETRKTYPHTLPSHPNRLTEKYTKYSQKCSNHNNYKSATITWYIKVRETLTAKK